MPGVPVPNSETRNCHNQKMSSSGSARRRHLSLASSPGSAAQGLRDRGRILRPVRGSREWGAGGGWQALHCPSPVLRAAAQGTVAFAF